MVLPITLENNHMWVGGGGGYLVNAEKFTDMQINVGSYTSAVEGIILSSLDYLQSLFFL
jgi:hypothetical protein